MQPQASSGPGARLPSVRREARPHRLASLVMIVGIAGLPGCGNGEPLQEPPWMGETAEQDSAGVRIVVAPGASLSTVLPWRISELPDLVLGHRDDDASHQFHRIAGAAGLPDGGVVVVDGGSRELRWFSETREHVHTVGGSGEGPLEFTAPRLLTQFQPDTLLIFDGSRMTFTWVTLDGSGGRRLAPLDGGVTGTPQVASGSWALFRSASGVGTCRENESCELPLHLRWVGLEGAGRDTVAVFTFRFLQYREDQPFPLLLDGPLDPAGLAAPGPMGLVVEGGPGFELRQFDRDDRLVAIYRVDAPPEETPEEALERFIQRFADPGVMRRVYALMSMPEEVPAYRSLRVDALGSIWAERFRSLDEDP